jgi:hypothetical protein
MSMPANTAGRRWQFCAVAGIFVAVAVLVGWAQPAWDLRGEYVAARVIADGQIAHLYDQAHFDAARQQGSAWASAALAGGIKDGIVVSYIKTPLWAWLLAPAAGALDFDSFKRGYAALLAAMAVSMVYLAARTWTPRLASPVWLCLLLTGLFVSVPFFAALLLGQSHVLFVFLLACAAIAEVRGRPVSAGTLLALTAAVKITPVWLALTWLVAGRWRALAAFGAVSLALLTLTIAAAGWTTVATFIATLRQFGGTVLLAGNNDSLASVLLGGALNDETAFHWRTVQSPSWVGMASVLALAACAAGAGLLDKRPGLQPQQRLGAVVTIVAATAFSPLAWNHYYIVLIFPVMLFLDAARGRGRAVWACLAAAVFLLSVPPLAYTFGAPMGIVALRSEFWAAVLCLGAMPVLALRHSPLSAQAV